MSIRKHVRMKQFPATDTFRSRFELRAPISDEAVVLDIRLYIGQHIFDQVVRGS